LNGCCAEPTGQLSEHAGSIRHALGIIAIALAVVWVRAVAGIAVVILGVAPHAVLLPSAQGVTFLEENQNIVRSGKIFRVGPAEYAIRRRNKDFCTHFLVNKPTPKIRYQCFLGFASCSLFL
jgi:hypothetical protein